tara:strand:+ start:172 stop:912 length:741 start_codon:yes stop_codon:yes gene_type:complete
MPNYDSKNFEIYLSNYSGPLDILLDLAKSQKVNLAEISITELADQFHKFINEAKKLNLDLASEYLLMATWLTYLKSKLLLPEIEEDEFKAIEVAEKLKSQLKKLELIRILSDQMLKRKRLGIDIFTRGIKGGIRSIYSSNYSVTLYEILKSYSNHVMKKDFMRINIPRLPVLTTEEGIKNIRSYFGKLTDWKNLTELIPKKFNKSKFLKKTGLASLFAGSLELSKEGDIEIKQTMPFDNLFIRQKQ